MKPEKDTEREEFIQVLKLLFGLAIFGVILLVLMSLYIKAPEGVHSIISILFNCSIFLIISISTMLFGFFVGFIFAVPKENNTINNNKNSQKYYLDNDNLVQISDWLTKIIVGVGLTQIYQIPSFLKQLANYFSSVLVLDDQYGFLYGNALVASILYFTFLGFLISYYWTRLKYKLLLTVTDDDIDSRLEEKDNEIKIKNQLIATRDETIQNIKAAIDNTGMIIKDESISHKYNDPQKGKWGGLTAQNDRVIQAKVWPTSWDSELFHIELTVKSTNILKPLEGKVKFYLHPSFNKSEPEIETVGGIATLNIIAWGAFTVGAELDNGNTKLEIDLAEDNINAPKIFKER